jgi:segregation and condensation protein A
MDGRAADPEARLADNEHSFPNAGPLDGAGDGEAHTPVLALDGFNGPLERLLILARAQRIDLARIPIGDLVDQLASALRQAPPTTPLGQKGDWVVMASWLVQLRSLLLLPAESPAQQAAEIEAEQLREHLVTLQAMQALAAWLDHRPQLGRDVFARGQPEVLGQSIETTHQVDVIEFLWASLTLFDDDNQRVDTNPLYRPRWLDLYSVADARARILRLLAESPEGHRLDTLLPEASATASTETHPVSRQRSAWASTFIASLELAKQGDVVLAQDGVFAPIHVGRPPVESQRHTDTHGRSAKQDGC